LVLDIARQGDLAGKIGVANNALLTAVEDATCNEGDDKDDGDKGKVVLIDVSKASAGCRTTVIGSGHGGGCRGGVCV
jgi:hypothetical protein